MITNDCEYKCQFNGIKCNSNQKWTGDKYCCEHKNSCKNVVAKMVNI